MKLLRTFCMTVALLFVAWAGYVLFTRPLPAGPASAPVATSTLPETAAADRRTVTEETDMWSVKVIYPVLGNAKADAALDATVQGIIAEFKANATDLSKLPGEPKPTWKNELRIEYLTSHFSKDIPSVRLDVFEFTGGAHPNHASVTRTFDLRSGKELKLADVFRAGTNYLSQLSQISREELARSMPDADLEMLRTGTAPRDENFQSFTLDEQGMRLIFDPYQVAPYAAGTQEVYVGWGRLRDIVLPEFRPEFN
jgi:peptidoglycan-N-acetylglucosamine deacetylase